VRSLRALPHVCSLTPCAVVAVPMNALLAIALLYALLGWASLVGFAVMAVLFPVPARLGALMGGTHAKRMAAVRGRPMLGWSLAADVLPPGGRPRTSHHGE
jgi:hypothetical protein